MSPRFEGAAFEGGWRAVLCVRCFRQMGYSPMDNLRVAGAADEFLRSRRFDCMIRTCPPLGSLTVVDRLARGHGVPWSTDLRDVPDEYDSERTKWLFRQRCQVRESDVLQRSPYPHGFRSVGSGVEQ